MVFVGAVESLARSVGLDETLLSLVIAPIATELPEKLNSVIWIRRGKDTLALGNITGAMVFQAAIPTSIALLFASREWSIGSGSWVAFASADDPDRPAGRPPADAGWPPVPGPAGPGGRQPVGRDRGLTKEPQNRWYDAASNPSRSALAVPGQEPFRC